MDEAAGRVQFGCQRNFLNPIISKLDKHVVLLLINYIASQYIGHCSVRYEFHARVARTISHAPTEHKIHIFEHVMFSLSHKRANDTVFDDFPKISDHFPKISEDFPKLFRRPDERFRTFSEQFRTFSEDYRRLLKTTEEDPKMFRSYTNKF